MITLLDLSTIVDRLKAECPLLQNRAFETVASNDAALELYGSPAAFVYLANDSSEPNVILAGLVQAHSNGIAIKLSQRKTQSLTDQTNASDAQQLRLLRQQVLTALLGFKPTGAEKLLEHVSGELTETDRYLVWTDTVSTQDYLNNT